MMTSHQSLLPSPARPHQRLSPFWSVVIVVIGGLVILTLWPIGAMLVRLFFVDGSLTIQPFISALSQTKLLEVVANTIIVTVVSTAASVVIGFALAYANERTDARLGPLTSTLPMLPFLVSPIAGAVGWIFLLSPRAGYVNVAIRDLFVGLGIPIDDQAGPFSIYSWFGLIFVYSIYMVPLAFITFTSGLRNSDPSLEEASRITGSSEWRTLFRIVLPSQRPALGSAIMLLMWFALALFSVPVALGPGADIEVLSMRIVTLLRSSYPPETATATVLGIIVLALLALAWYIQRRLVRGGHYSTITGKAQRQSIHKLGRARWAVRAVFIAYVLVAAVLPLSALIHVTLRGYWGRGFGFDEFSLSSLVAVIENPLTATAFRNSIFLGVVGAALCMFAAALLAYVKHAGRSRGWIVGMADVSVRLPAAISGLVLAVGCLIAFTGSPLNLQGTLLILLLAYITHYIPQAVNAADAAAIQVGRELADASRVEGASEGRTFTRVFAPLMLPGLASGAAIVFVVITGDLTSSVILAGPRNPVVGLRILEIVDSASYAELAAVAVLLTAVCAAVLAVVMGASKLPLAARASRGWLADRRRSSGAVESTGSETAPRSTHPRDADSMREEEVTK